MSFDLLKKYNILFIGLLPSKEYPIGDTGIVTYLTNTDLSNILFLSKYLYNQLGKVLWLEITKKFEDKRKLIFEQYFCRLKQANKEERKEIHKVNREFEVIIFDVKEDLTKAKRLIEEGGIIENIDLFNRIIYHIGMEYYYRNKIGYSKNLLERIKLICEYTIEYKELFEIREGLNCFNAVWTTINYNIGELLNVFMTIFGFYDYLQLSEIKFYMDLVEYIYNISEFNILNTKYVNFSITKTKLNQDSYIEIKRNTYSYYKYLLEAYLSETDIKKNEFMNEIHSDIHQNTSVYRIISSIIKFYSRKNYQN